MREILPEEIERNPFKMINNDWLLITAEKDGKVNTMTASWGGVGILWGKKVAFVFIRDSRYTKEFVDSNDKLSLSVLPEKFRKELNYFGRVSGRDEDKIANAGLKVDFDNSVPYFADSELVMICKKLYAQRMSADCFTDKSLVEKNYSSNDWHTTYVLEIEKVLEK